MTALGSSRYLFHGLRIAVRAPPSLIELLDSRMRPFVRSADPAGGPVDLTYVFSEPPSGSPHPITAPAPARPVYDPVHGEVLYGTADDVFWIGYGDRIAARYQAAESRVDVSTRDWASDTLWLLSHPIFTLPLMEFLKRQGRFSVHASGVAFGDAAILMPGASGSGKSTLALALARQGVAFMGDDMQFLVNGEGGIRAQALPDEVDLTEGTIALFDELRPLAEQPLEAGWPKRRIRVEDTHGTPLALEARPRALVFPRVAHTDRSELSPLSRAHALLELAPNVLLTHPGSSQAHFDALARLVQQCACYRLATGRDFSALPDLLRALV